MYTITTQQYNITRIPEWEKDELEQTIRDIKQMSDNEIRELYQQFKKEYVRVIDWDNLRGGSKYVHPQDNILDTEGYQRGPRNNLNQSFLNIHNVFLQLGTEMLKRNIENEYGYYDIPYYEINDGKITFHKFIPTGE